MHISARVTASVMLITTMLLYSHAGLAQTTQVEVYTPSATKQPRVMTLSGSVEARHNAQLASQESGLVEALLVDAGDTVSKGDPLLKLDATLAELNLAQARAGAQAAEVSVNEAQRLLDEVAALSKKQSVAQTLIGERTAALANAKAEQVKQQALVALAQERLHRHTLYAPFTGVIGQRSVDMGEWVTPGNQLFTLVAESDLRIVVNVPQEYFPLLRSTARLPVMVTPDINAAKPIKAEISRIVAVTDPSSRTFTAHIDLTDTMMVHAQFTPGMSAQADLLLSAQDSAVWIPKKAVKQHPDGGSSVFIADNNTAKRKMVTITASRPDYVAVTGLTGNESVITTGIELLKEGTQLQISARAGNLQ
ncbi:MULTISPECIES: efflux RND transporter periplasmic adaptor subunit [unclassified Pseudoalteromonas]|uniref:efflux RND transporter periplasmic adaptor subunit n=1 Tax=unclassified Pseudoalteromonas TaxID=194690 RepID=UPI002096C6C4|nr:efflux RND transporter periplasmic adaptor subunit [Pseudoalteromonas sp. XMcav2-N]MCO7187543.1 efflux RND transporter periplasmic adaptor subunit [Pseudoalteromonas sp. XMcav2-N]